MLLEALGCGSPRRWVSVWWGGGATGEPFWTDGAAVEPAYAPAWHALTRDHVFCRIVFEPYALNDDPAQPTWDPPHRLIVDRVAATLAVACREDVGLLLAGEPAGSPAAPAPAPPGTDLRRAARVEALRDWLDAALDWVDTRLEIGGVGADARQAVA